MACIELGAQGVQISWQLFDRLRTGSAKNLCGSSNYEILRRPLSAGLLRMTPINVVSGWALTNNALSEELRLCV